MSWTIESSRSASDIVDFHKAVKEAEEKDIIMFCAFSDQGNVSSTDCFPSEFQETLTVGAATSLGHPCTWVNKELVQPGEHIIIEANPTSPSKPESGSSMATALAAGLAALLLYITQLVKPEAYEQLRKPKEMKDRLMKVGGTEKYIPAKDLFRLEFKDDPNWRWNSRTKIGQEKMGYLVSKFTVSHWLFTDRSSHPVQAIDARYRVP
jgi:Subtilase family